MQPLVAYFCAEFALDERLPIYSGGLGVLAGDVVRQAADETFPMVGVGLFYREGYFRQQIANGEQQESYETINPLQAGLELVTEVDGKPKLIEVMIGATRVKIQIWRHQAGCVPIYLLDANLEENHPFDREITLRLYGGDLVHRLKQEVVLGIGGIKALEALNVAPSVYHLNEGHSALAVLPLTSRYMQLGDNYEIAIEKARSSIVFTNHTVVPAGNDIFTFQLVRDIVGPYASQENLPLENILEIGRLTNTTEDLFGMTPLSLAISKKANGVSNIHSIAAKKLWPSYQLIPITNGIHLPNWVADNIKQLTSNCNESALKSLKAENISTLHDGNKGALIRYIATETNIALQSDVATLVWARRFAAYKQPDLIFSDIEAIRRILTSAQQPLQIIIAGKAHPFDSVGKDIIKNINHTISSRGLSKSVIFLPHYTVDSAKTLVQGADIWLNTPIRGQEASGTSGMKAGANGVLQCTVSDGWADEVNWDNIGWILDNDNTADSLYGQLQNNILPVYYLDKPAWQERMKKTMEIIWLQFSAKRMLNEYKRMLYNT